MSPIYLDYNATTPLDERVLEAMMPYLTNRFGNAASRTHFYGWEAAQAIDLAREQVADLIGATAKEIVFTSGATESNNLAIKGLYYNLSLSKNHILTLKTEHKAILDACASLEKTGVQIAFLPIDKHGIVAPNALVLAIKPNTFLVSVMYANNETGVIQDIEKIGEICRENNVVFHTDATQAVGKLGIDVTTQNIDLLSLSAHKFYGPKGVGALFVKKGLKINAQLNGGSQERGMRAGTLNVPSIVGMGKAAQIAKSEMFAESQRLEKLRNHLENTLLGFGNIKANGLTYNRLAHVCNLTFEGQDGELLMMKLKDLAVSNGSACTSALVEPSHVLKALGLSDAQAHASIRFSLGRYTTPKDIETTIEMIKAVLL